MVIPFERQQISWIIQIKDGERSDLSITQAGDRWIVVILCSDFSQIEGYRQQALKEIDGRP